MSEIFAKRAFFASAALLSVTFAFFSGLVVEQYHFWPYDLIHSAWSAAKSLKKYGALIPEGRRVAAAADSSHQTIVIHDPSRIDRGYYIFVGWDKEIMLYAAWLYDYSGRYRHTWKIDYGALHPDGPVKEPQPPHPFYVLGDGSIIVGFDRGDIMARIDACGEPIWVKNGIYNHSLSRAEDGSFWTWRGEGTAYGHYSYMENFDADTGNKIREIALVEDIIKKLGPLSVVFGVRPDYPFRKYESGHGIFYQDIFHPNDADVLNSDLAPKFPMFKTGDLLVSFRSLHLVAVVDPDDRRLKWWSHGPWLYQHDPDFTSDGKISVYNNNTDRGRSEIIKMDPATREVSNELFNGEVTFYSGTMGKHQYLPNGNVLITVPEEGRILEVTEDGKKVMEFNNLSSYSPDFNEHVENAMWVPLDYFQTIPNCRK